ncbi:uncharacterized protein LOC118407070 [Branchiostoma floridae]|uniref:Uncharacterized protein LOC118407070 n=1 Tax=Branchiostoma floridae TaxID=7739 RepID=A0A9J7KAP0_BRAFL|nr:uncharacterized protein LOC118407070 [Branchiostoma floridae]
MLDLRYNRIHTVKKGSFDALYRLRILRLTGNKLKVVRADWFPAVEEQRLLFNFELARNQIEYIEPGAFKNVPLLGNLDLSNNHLTNLHYGVVKLQTGWRRNIHYIRAKMQGNPIRCICTLDMYFEFGLLTKSDFELLTCSYPHYLQGTKLNSFTGDMTKTIPCPTPKLSIVATGDRSFRCELCWEEEPLQIQWTLPNITDIPIADVSYGKVTHINIVDVNITASFYITPNGFDCCNSTFDHPTLSNSTCNFVGKTISSLKVSENLLKEWIRSGEVISCTALFEENIKVQYNVSGVERATPLLNTVRYTNTTMTYGLVNATGNRQDIVFLLKSGLNGTTVSIHFLDLIITALFTLAVMAFSYAVFLMLRKTQSHDLQTNQPESPCNQPSEQLTEEVSVNTYETVEDRPPMSNQDEIISDSETPNSEDVIVPYGQATMSGAYGTGAAMRAEILVSTVTEADSGKGSCDRQAAMIKSHIKAWINEEHNVETADEFKAAVESNGGVPGVKVYRCEVNVDATVTSTKFEGITKLNNFEFTDAGLRVWRAFDIGEGKLIPWSKLPAVEPSTLVIISEPYNPGSAFRPVESRRKKSQPQLETESDSEEEAVSHETPAQTQVNIFQCPEEGCVKVYQTFRGLDAHVAVGRHNRRLERETLLDKAKLMYAAKLEKGPSEVPRLETASEGKRTTECPVEGWALRGPRKRVRFTAKQTAYLERTFHLGERTGKKSDPQTVAKAMRHARDLQGQRLFGVNDFLTTQQVSSYFSRLAGKRQKPTEDDEVEQLDPAVLESVNSKVQNEVMNNVHVRHPVLYDTYNL